MAKKQNSLDRFWKELKRRKVVHVITVYAATAFVILEVVDMIAQPLLFPEWTQAFIIVLLCIGFIISVIVSWVYDITPSGVSKTKPVSVIKHGEPATHAVPSGWRIATYASAVIIIGLLAFNFISRRNINADISKLEKSIAVLPFRNESPDTTNIYYINGLMERLTTNLSMIKELRVISRNSVEKYRNNKTKSAAEIAKDLGVNYIIEGSGQKLGNSISITSQLIKPKGKETHLWARTYDQEIVEVSDYIKIMSEIAEKIATELKAVITPEEKKLIDKTPTQNLTALDFYQTGREEQWKYQIDPNNLTALDKAEDLFIKVLQYDPTYAQAYLGLASVYWNKNLAKEYFSENYLDSVLDLANTALSHDDDLAEAYVLRGDYFRVRGYGEKALVEYDKALDINKSSWEAYFGKAQQYWDEDMVATINNLHRAISINRGRELPYLLSRLGDEYSQAGFPEIAERYYREILQLNHDSVAFYLNMSRIESNSEDIFKYYRKAYRLDSTNIDLLGLIATWFFDDGQYKESLVFGEKWLEKLDKTLVMSLRYNAMQRVGVCYLKNNKLDEAEYYFDLQLGYNNREINSNLPQAQKYWSYYDRAGVYAFRGEKAKAYEDLRIFNKRTRMPLWMADLIKVDQLFDSIRDEPEFQQIVRDVEAKYQAEHERVRKWLEEQGMI